jgi:adenylosuccinate lyase
MKLSPLTAISPVDGRYRRSVEALDEYFSEAALMKYRTRVEVDYFVALCEIPLPQLTGFKRSHYGPLKEIYRSFSIEDAREIKEIESRTNHDVKAVEYFLKERFDRIGLSRFKEFIHLGLTSQDINNTALPLSLKDAWHRILKPALAAVIERLDTMARQWKDVPMLARTHGQPASPTTLGKEIYVFVDRLNKQLKLLDMVPFSAKFGGAVGNFNAHRAAYPDIDWVSFGDHFVNSVLGLDRTRMTTQIEPYDNLAAFFDNLKRIDTILIDLDRDLWAYISMNYFKQKIQPGEVGSSTMPHKINPIDFENSEGNIGVANALFEHFSAKLPISRLQRDLTDSTVTRNVGVPMAHMLIGLKSLIRGLNKLILNPETIREDLDENWAVVSEAIQTILRREGVCEPYEKLKELTRTHDKIDRESIEAFVRGLEIADSVKEEILKITPHNYTGICNF